MSIEFTNTNKKNIFIEFILKNTNTPLANGIRRILLNDIPIVSFNKNIKINKNNTSLHNEFLQHRISLIPIDNHNFNFKSYYDFNLNKRIYEFIDIPNEFTLISKNDNKDNYKSVTSKDFKINNSIASNYFKPDPYFNDTDEFVLITYLKFNNNFIEEIDISSIPDIGTANEHSCYNPTGTVSYSFVKEDTDIINSKMKQYIKYIQDERKQKNLDIYNSTELNSIKKDFLILESDRIYKKNQYKFKIESIGNLYPYELLYNSIVIFQLKLIDLLSNITFKDDSIYFSNRISSNNDDLIYNLTLYNEDHTLGNVINEYINDKFNIYTEYCSYKIQHPLKKNIVLKIKLKNNLEQINQRLFYYENDYNIKFINKNNYIIYIFEYSIINILKDLENIKKQVSTQFSISKTNFNIDNLDLLNNFVNI